MQHRGDVSDEVGCWLEKKSRAQGSSASELSGDFGEAEGGSGWRALAAEHAAWQEAGRAAAFCVQTAVTSGGKAVFFSDSSKGPSDTGLINHVWILCSDVCSRERVLAH